MQSADRIPESHPRHYEQETGQMERCGMGAFGTSISDAVGAMQRRVVEFREQGFEKITEDVVDYVRTQPVNALLIAAGLGMVLGILSGVRRR
jgi:hypothetical protein